MTQGRTVNTFKALKVFRRYPDSSGKRHGLQKVHGEVGDGTGRETLALSIRQACEGAWDGVGTETQTGSRVWSCEVPWVRAPKRSSLQVSDFDSGEERGVSRGGMRGVKQLGRMRLCTVARVPEAGWGSGEARPRRAPHTRASSHRLARPGPGGLHLPGRPQTPHAERRARGIPRGGSEPKQGLPQPGTARLPAALGRRPRQPQEAPAQEAAALARHVTPNQLPAVRMCSGSGWGAQPGDAKGGAGNARPADGSAGRVGGGAPFPAGASAPGVLARSPRSRRLSPPCWVLEGGPRTLCA